MPVVTSCVITAEPVNIRGTRFTTEESDLCPNFKDLRNTDKFNYLFSDGPVVKVVARFFYLASLIHSCVNVS